jgi:hypothetical protein
MLNACASSMIPPTMAASRGLDSNAAMNDWSIFTTSIG